MDSEKAILLSLILNYQTLSLNRNEDEKQLAIDITDNETFNNQSVKLTANNAEGTNPKSRKEIEDIASFFYLYSPFPTEVQFTKADNTEFTLNLENVALFTKSSDATDPLFTKVVVVNRNQEQALTIKLIYS